MLLNIMCLFLLATTPAQDSVLAKQCQSQNLDQSVCSIFQTLLDAWQAQPINHALDHGENSHSPLSGNFLTVSAYEKQLKCRLTPSAITDSSYRITVGESTVTKDSVDFTTQVIGFFNSQSEGHLPIARLCFFIEAHCFYYEYITADSTCTLTY